jgi:hypothetical protein
VLLKSGEAVRVTDSSGQQIRGQLLDLSPTSLTILSKGVRRELAASDVDLISASRHGSLATGAKWGLGTGAAFGGFVVLMAVNSYGRCNSECVGYMVGASLVYGGVGAGIGVGVSALTTSQHIIFARSGSSNRTLAFAPIVDATRKGAMVNVKW